MDIFLSKFAARLHEKISELEIETNRRKRYGVRVGPEVHGQDELKLKIKSLLRQDEISEPYTQVEIYVADISTDFSVHIVNTPIYVYGLYIKMSREMSQTRMPARLGKKIRSVADFARDLVHFFSARKAKFIGSGREDTDVRMIGGRPFILEVSEPKKNLQFEALELSLYKEVDIFGMKRVSSQAKKYIHENQESKYKKYCALVYSRGMCKIKERFFEVAQHTPLRVLHRRSNLVRKRNIEIINSRIFGEYAFMTIRAQAGTYIKEFVTGDFGRTSPSITSLLNSFSDCLELDVLEVEHAELPEDCVLHDVLPIKTYKS